MDPSRGYSSHHYGAQFGAEQSTLEKITAKVYQAKLKVNKTLKKPEDEHLVASDAELDAKLETYRHVRQSCTDLQRIVSMYATRVYALAQAENELGRYLKQHGERDRTRAGKMMQATGKSLSCASQQRLALRVPLTRLGGEVETFSNRAVIDCESKVHEMETARNNYRSSLLWMKDVSERLDPEAYNRLEKFRKVQAQVKRSKEYFDRQKLDAMQKVDLLVASRCNMFSRVLVLYQQTIVQFSHKTARIMCAVADAFQGYQFFEFNMLRELTDCTRKLARETSSRVAGTESSSDADTDDYDDGEETLKQVESKLTEIVSDQSLSTQPGLNDADTLRLPALGGAFSYGASSTAQQPSADAETQDATQLYDHVRRSVFQQNAEQNEAQQTQAKSALKLNPQPKPIGDGDASKKQRRKHVKASQSADAIRDKDANRRGPIRDDADYADEPSTQRGDPNPDIALEKLDELFAKEYQEDEDAFTEAIDLSVSSKKTQKETAAASHTSTAAAAALAAAVQSGAVDALLLEGLDMNATPDADRALLNDLFGTTNADADLDSSFFQSQATASSGSAPLMTSEFARMFGVASTKPKAAISETATSLGDDDPWNSFAANLPSRQMDALMQSDGDSNAASSAQQAGAAERVSPRPNSTESALLENLSKFSSKGGAQQQAGPSLASLAAQRGGNAPGPAPPAANISLNLAAATSSKAAAPPSNVSKKDAAPGGAKKEDLAAWFNMFADLDPLANPDKVGRKPGQDDGFNEA